jgi:signal recognition particle subunit SRP54
MRRVTGCPIKFIGVGEKSDQLEVFHPDRMAQRILDMGDIVTLVEKAQEEIDEKEAMKVAERMQAGKFDFTDFLSQMKMMKRLGSMTSLLGMLPGMGKMKDLLAGVDAEKSMKHLEAMVLSMTKEERSNPSVINQSRKRRIASGSGRSLMEVNSLLERFEMMRKLFGNKGLMGQMMSGMMGGGGGGGMPDMGSLANMMGGGFPGMPGMKMPKASQPPPAQRKMHKRFKF